MLDGRREILCLSDLNWLKPAGSREKKCMPYKMVQATIAGTAFKCIMSQHTGFLLSAEVLWANNKVKKKCASSFCF